jgi:hypothetical protein
MLRRITLLILAAGVTLSGQVAAQKTDFLFSNRFYGAISAGLGVYFLTEANNARSDGKDAYERYEATGSSLLAREFYDESKQKDTKAAIMLGLGVGTITYGIHLLMKGDGDRLPDPRMDRGLIEIKGVKIDAGADPVRGQMGLQLRRSF